MEAPRFPGASPAVPQAAGSLSRGLCCAQDRGNQQHRRGGQAGAGGRCVLRLQGPGRRHHPGHGHTDRGSGGPLGPQGPQGRSCSCPNPGGLADEAEEAGVPRVPGARRAGGQSWGAGSQHWAAEGRRPQGAAHALVACSASHPPPACTPPPPPGHRHRQVPRRRAHQQRRVGGGLREGRAEVRGPGASLGLLPRASLQRVHLGRGRHEELGGGRFAGRPPSPGLGEPRRPQTQRGTPDPCSGWKPLEWGRVSRWSPCQRVQGDWGQGCPLSGSAALLAPVAPR